MQRSSSSGITLRWRRTKIIATIGPGTDSRQKIDALIKAGVNVFRLNMSHGDHDYHRKVFGRIRQCANRNAMPIAILMDLCGPKIRVGKFRHGAIELRPRQEVVISCAAGVGDDGLIISQYRQLYKDVKPGERILLDDGNMECRVLRIEGRKVIAKVVYGGLLNNNKGMNLPDSTVSVSSFTAKDKLDVRLAMELCADFVALSFVRDVSDIDGLARYMKRYGKDKAQVIPIIAKIEKPEAIDNIEQIISSAYGIMIARGDLGIELPAEEVPLIQRRLISLARNNHCPVIVATQMMESMINNSRPTRAEVGDVANAALTSADAVMLSAETAIGKYPIKAVRMMDRILREIEREQWLQGGFSDDLDACSQSASGPSARRAVAHAANALARELKLQGILVPTHSGHTAAVLAACRPSSPLIGLAIIEKTSRILALHWGIIPCHIDEKEARNWKVLSNDISHRFRLTDTGNRVLLVSGFNDDEKHNEPLLKIMRVDRARRRSNQS